jgi:hypothetical protein
LELPYGNEIILIMYNIPILRSGFIRFYGQNPERFAKRWGIEPFSIPCDGCGIMLTTDIPFATLIMRGLVAKYCKCGNLYPPYAVVCVKPLP